MSPLLIVLFLTFKITLTVDYCADNLQCKRPQLQEFYRNSACNCEFRNLCKNYKIHKATPSIRKRMLEFHNKYRDHVASGSEKRGGTPGEASQMYALQYDKDLEHVMNCWNKQCMFAHDKCRRTEKRPSVGQNLYRSSGRLCKWETELNSATKGWYEEVVYMVPECFTKFPASCDYKKVGHFTQMIWADTTHIGCAMIEYDGKCQIGCNYGPSGNVLTRQVYNPGKSECKFRSKKYKHLCLLTKDQEDNEDSDVADSSKSLSYNSCYLVFYAISFIMFNF